MLRDLLTGAQGFELDVETKIFVRAKDRASHEAKKRGKAVVPPGPGAVYKLSVVEPSEEVRLRLCGLVGAVLDAFVGGGRGGHSQLMPYFHETVLFLHECAVDPYPELKVAGLARLEALASDPALPDVFHFYCTPLVRAVMRQLHHRHAKVRLATIAAVRALVSCPFRDKCRGGGTEAIADLVGHREENVIPIHAFYSGEVRENYFARLVVDRSTPVRRAFYAMVADWLATLPDRPVLSQRANRR